MKISLAFAPVLILSAALPHAAARQQPAELTARTQAPEPVEIRGGGVLFGMTEAEYRKIASRLTKLTAFVPIRRKPRSLSPRALFGLNLSFGGRNRSWALDGDECRGYTLYADLNADGDLANDRPLKFEPEGGKPTLRLRHVIKETRDGRPQSYTVEMKLQLKAERPPGETTTKLSIERFDDTVRRGTLRAAGRDVAFALLGSQGIYNWDYNEVVLDTNGDGKLDMEPGLSVERYMVGEKYVNLGDQSYEFVVDPYGRSLTLRPLAERLPDRAVLLPGYDAPDFTFTDVEGRTRRLSDFRGKVVLLDFWASWCGPCVKAAPKLVEAYEKLRGRGFEIIGVNSGDEPEDFRKFVAERRMGWAQTRERQGDPLHRLFRVRGFPAYFLIGRDGKIISNRIETDDFVAEVEKHLGQ
jgi:thiol-disulfide isomerase/thioredoxin